MIKIRTLLTGVFLLFSLTIGITGYLSANAAQQKLEDFIGERGIVIATRMADRIESVLDIRLDQIRYRAQTDATQKAISTSNEEFERRGNIQTYIDEQEKTWIIARDTTPFVQNILDNELSIELKNLVRFYAEDKGYPVFAEIFVTNSYGAVVSATGKTTDYRQDDEEWWQIANGKGTYLRDVAYDESAGVYGTDFSVRVEDNDGRFAGVMKATINIQEIINTMGAIKEAELRKGIEVKLLDRTGRIIYSTEGEEFLSQYEEFELIKGDSGYIETQDGPNKEGKIISFIFSSGKKQFSDLGWAYLVVESKTEETFGPLSTLRRSILITTIIFAVLSIIIGLVIANQISKPLSKLQERVDEISKGNFKVEIEKLDTIFEISKLSESLSRIVKTMKLAVAERGTIKMKGDVDGEKSANRFVQTLMRDDSKIRKKKEEKE